MGGGGRDSRVEVVQQYFTVNVRVKCIIIVQQAIDPVCNAQVYIYSIVHVVAVYMPYCWKFCRATYIFGC